MTGIEAEFEVVPGPDPQADPVETILVVDDEAPIREVLEEYLLGLGYRVQTARDGREALDFLRECDFDLVITDLVMPRMDGFALIRAAQ